MMKGVQKKEKPKKKKQAGPAPKPAGSGNTSGNTSSAPGLAVQPANRIGDRVIDVRGSGFMKK